ncbi:MAG: protein kinase domain-containing protein, partial [Planctomycetota bacterium]
MSPTDQTIEAIFTEAIGRRGHDAREAYLDGACRGDAALRDRVEALLRAADEADEFLEEAATGATGPLSELEGPGATIGRYKLLQKIGEGGFGTVYMAEQERPVQRRVALKIIKLGMDTRQVVARFEAERQALAMMDHPNIARVLDAGATETGRPYFVMELVKGVPITEYCDRNKLETEERLSLFTDVCHAVQHAHQKGVIHRDLKPSNVMVTLHDGRPIPKVIDFGIAKALHRKLTERTLFTEYAQFVGTPQYMSPEQAEMSGLDVDTRSDVYALGVLLYELLTGTTPFDAKRLREAGYGEIQRIIREEEPERPSTRVSSLSRGTASSAVPDDEGADAPATDVQVIAHDRHTDPASLRRALRGDLDWIVMRCLEKDRTRRYETANGLVTDIDRHLRHEPVTASPPSRAYRFRKFARRNRGVLTTACVVLVALAGGLAVALSALQRERSAVAEANVVLGFLTDMLSAPEPGPAADPEEVGGRVTFRELLDQAARRVETEFVDRPLIEAQLRYTIGDTYHGLGHYLEAEPHKQRAWEIRRRTLGDEHPDTLLAARSVARLYRKTGRHEEAREIFERTAELQAQVLGPEDPVTLSTLNGLANTYANMGMHEQAERMHTELWETRERVLGPEDPATLNSMANVGWVYLLQRGLGDA